MKSLNMADPRKSETLSTQSQVIITAIICSVVFLLLGMFLGALFYHCAAVRYKRKCNAVSIHSAPPSASAPVVYEEVSPDSHTGRKNDIELSDYVNSQMLVYMQRKINICELFWNCIHTM